MLCYYNYTILCKGQTMENRERKYFAPLDLIIISVAVIASVFALLSQLYTNTNELTCVIRSKGEVVKTVALSQVDDKQYIGIDAQMPLKVCITKTEVWVEESSCPDKLCQHTGHISKSGQSIVCLPAKVSVTLEADVNEFDAVVG